MSSKTPYHPVQPPAKPVGNKTGEPVRTTGTKHVPAVVRRGRLTLRQIRHAVETALRGQTFEADAQS